MVMGLVPVLPVAQVLVLVLELEVPLRAELEAPCTARPHRRSRAR